MYFVLELRYLANMERFIYFSYQSRSHIGVFKNTFKRKVVVLKVEIIVKNNLLDYRNWYLIGSRIMILGLLFL